MFSKYKNLPLWGSSKGTQGLLHLVLHRSPDSELAALGGPSRGVQSSYTWSFIEVQIQNWLLWGSIQRYASGLLQLVLHMSLMFPNRTSGKWALCFTFGLQCISAKFIQSVQVAPKHEGCTIPSYFCHTLLWIRPRAP